MRGEKGSRRQTAEVVLTVLRDQPRPPLQEETDAPAARLDELDGAAVRHVLGALSVDLDDLVPDLQRKDGAQRGSKARSGQSRVAQRTKERRKLQSPRQTLDCDSREAE